MGGFGAVAEDVCLWLYVPGVLIRETSCPCLLCCDPMADIRDHMTDRYRQCDFFFSCFQNTLLENLANFADKFIDNGFFGLGLVKDCANNIPVRNVIDPKPRHVTKSTILAMSCWF
jgi:hypothetical protein